jgi:hypothetical protein
MQSLPANERPDKPNRRCSINSASKDSNSSLATVPVLSTIRHGLPLWATPSITTARLSSCCLEESLGTCSAHDRFAASRGYYHPHRRNRTL